jgi:hypothetical protein
MTTYTAGWNMPGYLPETDPETFDTLDDAAAYLRDTLARWLDEDDAPADMTAEDILTVDHGANVVGGWYTLASGGAEFHLWAVPTDA